MLSPPTADLESEQVLQVELAPEEFIHSTICLIADLHNELDREFQSLLQRTCPENSYDRTLEDLRGSRLEAFKRKLGETARQLALKQSGVLRALKAQEEKSLNLSDIGDRGQTEIIESAASLRFAVTTLGVFTVTAGMENQRFHPLGPIAQVMNKEGRVEKCLFTLERLRELLQSVERSFPHLDYQDNDWPVD